MLNEWMLACYLAENIHGNEIFIYILINDILNL